jgi:hypothetical protein
MSQVNPYASIEKRNFQERVRMLLKQELSVAEISAIIGRGQSLVKE